MTYKQSYCLNKEGLIVQRGVLDRVVISQKTLAIRDMKGNTYDVKSKNYNRKVKELKNKKRKC